MLSLLNKSSVFTLTLMTSSRYWDFSLMSVSQCLFNFSDKNRPAISTASEVCSAGVIAPVGMSSQKKEAGVGVFVSVHEPFQVRAPPLDEDEMKLPEVDVKLDNGISAELDDMELACVLKPELVLGNMLEELSVFWVSELDLELFVLEVRLTDLEVVDDVLDFELVVEFRNMKDEVEEFRNALCPATKLIKETNTAKTNNICCILIDNWEQNNV